MALAFYNCESKMITIEGFDEVIEIPCFTKSECIYDRNLSFIMNCILGILNTGKAEILFFVTENELIGVLDDVEYFRIIGVEYIVIESYEKVFDTYDSESVKNLIESQNFYYSFDEIEKDYCWNQVILDNYEKNKNILKKAKFTRSSKNLESHRSPFFSRTINEPPISGTRNNILGRIFCGYFEVRKINDNKKVFNLKIQSRISTRKIGTRMLCRGVDENGNVSFFVETRFIIEDKDQKDEFVIIRGSVPVYWSSIDPLKPHKIVLENTYEDNERSFKIHFSNLNIQYNSDICVVDLLGSRKDEKKLSKLYSELCSKNSINYIHFDLNNHTKSYSHLKRAFKEKLSHNIKKINARRSLNFKDIKEYTSKLAFTENEYDTECYARNMWEDDLIDNIIDKKADSDDESKDLIQNFKCIFRVNCMDCLDRTNICQSLIFWYSQKYRFKAIKSMWMNNGDALSNIYTGSNALKSELTSKGHISILDKFGDLMISANRMINNRFTDKEKQQAIDLLLGKYNEV